MQFKKIHCLFERQGDGVGRKRQLSFPACPNACAIQGRAQLKPAGLNSAQGLPREQQGLQHPSHHPRSPPTPPHRCTSRTLTWQHGAGRPSGMGSSVSRASTGWHSALTGLGSSVSRVSAGWHSALTGMGLPSSPPQCPHEACHQTFNFFQLEMHTLHTNSGSSGNPQETISD